LVRTLRSGLSNALPAAQDLLRRSHVRGDIRLASKRTQSEFIDKSEEHARHQPEFR
jgi:hypothetical protein